MNIEFYHVLPDEHLILANTIVDLCQMNETTTETDNTYHLGRETVVSSYDLDINMIFSRDQSPWIC